MHVLYVVYGHFSMYSQWLFSYWTHQLCVCNKHYRDKLV